MTLPKSPLAYTDCYDLLGRAMEDPVGVRVRQSDESAATYFRMRLNMARQLDRDANRDTYERDHPLYGKSQYDKLIFTIELDGNALYLYVRRRPERVAGEIESLSNGEQLAQLGPPKPLFLPRPAPTEDELELEPEPAPESEVHNDPDPTFTPVRRRLR